MVEFRLLGPVTFLVAGRPVDTGRPQQRAVLAALLVDADHVVTTETLIDRVWGETAPAGARRTLHAHMARVRQMLRQAGDRVPLRVVSGSGGYLLRVPAESVDLHRFRAWVARAAGSEPARQAELLREGLALWQGEPLSGVGGAWAARMRQAWRQEYLDAAVAWAEGEIVAGNPAAVIGPLTDLAGAHPFVESVTAVLMRALYAAGRPADALDRYAEVRRLLVDELGTDPAPALRAVHQAILRGALDPPVIESTGSAPAAGPVAVPAQLPADVAAFTGRAAELAGLDGWLSGAGGGAEDGGGSPPPIFAVTGTAGVGKTALAVRWAHRNRARFPDGQLYVNLRGYDPNEPMDTGDALARFLADLGVRGQDTPADLDGRAARYRSATAGRRMLIVLDNVSSAEQVRPLLPGTASCVVLVTSRDRLAGLVALQGAYRLELDLLPPDDAVTLLARLIGARADTELAAVARIAEQCVRLPLALRVAAEAAAARPGTPLRELVTELDDQQHRLELLGTGDDPRAALPAVFSWSLRRLPPPTAAMFRLLGLNPGPDLDAYAAAALAGTGLPQARGALASLAQAHLVEPTASARYGMHDLLRAYATSLVADPLAAELRAARRRLFDYYLTSAATATDQLFPADRHRRPAVPAPATPAPVLADPDTARAWLDAERCCLVATVAHAADRGWPSHAVRLSAVLFRYLDGGHHADALAVHGHALRAAARTADEPGQAQALRGLGGVLMRLGRHDEAVAHLDQALRLFRRAGDRIGEARALNNLGTAHMQVGRHEPAVAHYTQALRLYRMVDDRTGEARTIVSLGVVYGRLGRHELAAEHHRKALALCRQIGDSTGQAWATASLGDAMLRMRRHTAAAEHHRGALALYRQQGNPYGEAWVLDSLGAVHSGLGDPGRAAAYHAQALALFREMGDGDGESWALNGLGEVACDVGRPVDALKHHTAAHAVATTADARDQQARAQAGLGRAFDLLDELGRADQHLRQALALYSDLGMAEAEQVRTRLAALAR
jgi:DNA-binding SARP family transcriptional activator